MFDAYARFGSDLALVVNDDRRAKKAYLELLRRLEDELHLGPRPGAIAAPEIDIAQLPPGSWLLSFDFELEKPVFTKHEDLLLPTENSIRRERATGIPVVAASSWKGAIRGAIYELRKASLLECGKDDEAAIFGCTRENDGDAGARRGRAECFSTHFSFDGKIGKAVTQSLDRRRRTGTSPVNYETIPAGAKGHFTLLYCTFADGFLLGEQIQEESMRHMEILGKAVAVMLRQTGFGGKKSSGFGRAANELVEAGVVECRDGRTGSFTQIEQLFAGVSLNGTPGGDSQ